MPDRVTAAGHSPADGPGKSPRRARGAAGLVAMSTGLCSEQGSGRGTGSTVGGRVPGPPVQGPPVESLPARRSERSQREGVGWTQSSVPRPRPLVPTPAGPQKGLVSQAPEAAGDEDRSLPSPTAEPGALGFFPGRHFGLGF